MSLSIRALNVVWFCVICCLSAVAAAEQCGEPLDGLASGDQRYPLGKQRLVDPTRFLQLLIPALAPDQLPLAINSQMATHKQKISYFDTSSLLLEQQKAALFLIERRDGARWIPAQVVLQSQGQEYRFDARRYARQLSEEDSTPLLRLVKRDQRLQLRQLLQQHHGMGGTGLKMVLTLQRDAISQSINRYTAPQMVFYIESLQLSRFGHELFEHNLVITRHHCAASTSRLNANEQQYLQRLQQLVIDTLQQQGMGRAETGSRYQKYYQLMLQKLPILPLLIAYPLAVQLLQALILALFAGLPLVLISRRLRLRRLQQRRVT